MTSSLKHTFRCLGLWEIYLTFSETIKSMWAPFFQDFIHSLCVFVNSPFIYSVAQMFDLNDNTDNSFAQVSRHRWTKCYNILWYLSLFWGLIRIPSSTKRVIGSIAVQIWKHQKIKNSNLELDFKLKLLCSFQCKGDGEGIPSPKVIIYVKQWGLHEITWWEFGHEWVVGIV